MSWFRWPGAVAAAILVGACAGHQAVPEKATLRLTTFGFFEENSAATPLGENTWLIRAGEARVPILDTGTDMGQVVTTLHEWGLKPLIGSREILVLEGPSRHNFGLDEPHYVIYGFTDGRLTVGPLDQRELTDVFMFYGPSAGDFELLAAFDKAAPLSAESWNNIAWTLATYHDPEKRAPELAVNLALRAVRLSAWSNYAHLDTLAAAHAAASDFEAAVAAQQLAVIFANGRDKGVGERLALYEEAVPFVAPASAANTPEAENPPLDLYEKALAGDPAAQYELGAYCIENELDTLGGIERPGAHWLKLAADQGHVLAIQEMGYGYLHGVNHLPYDPAAADQWLHKGAALDGDLAAFNLAMMYRDELGMERDDDKVTSWLMIAADRGVSLAAIEVAFRLREGVGVAPNPQAAATYLDMGIAAGANLSELISGEADSFFYTINSSAATSALPGLTVAALDYPEHLMVIVDNMERESARGEAYITARFSDSLTGWPATEAPAIIFLLTEKAAQLGSQRAQRKLAKLYKLGAGVEASSEEAHYWRRRAQRNSSGL